ncbi:MAG: hypothetical protein ACRDY2_11905 [Acidimicrobiales bacterium]
MQRFPIPTSEQIQNATGYAGGKHRKGSWDKLQIALNAFTKTPDRDTVMDVRSSALTCRATFQEKKKQKRVGALQAANITNQLDLLLADCDIQLLLFEIKDLKALGEPEVISGVEMRLARIRGLAINTVDGSGELKRSIARLDDENRGRVSTQLIELLRQHGYSPQGSFWYPTSGDFDYPLPHVAWKAHLAATGLRQALDVVGNSIPIFKSLGVQHKVDTNPEMFKGTQKLVTIYPPRDSGHWRVLIAKLESAVGGQLKVPPGELPVGRAQRVGMRHGQVTGLTTTVLEANANTRCSPGATTTGGYKLATLTPLGPGSAPPIQTTQPRSDLIFGTGSQKSVLFFHYPSTGKIHTGILLNGTIRPDPREAPNPYDEPLPEGVVLRESAW